MTALLKFLGDPAVRYWYMAFCFGVMWLPMIGLTWWYHSNICNTAGGRELMKRQNAPPARPHSATSLAEAAGMARDIARGRYGSEAASMQNGVYWFVGVSVIANVVVFGLMIGAMDAYRTN